MKRIFLVALFTLMLIGCADSVSFSKAESVEPVGFFYGLWHGLIIIFAWIGSLFCNDIAIYAIYNNGGWYDFGYVLGVGGFSLSAGIFHDN